MDLEYLKVKGKDHLLRDPISNGIINIDDEGYKKYVENYKRSYNNAKRIENLESDLDSIKNDLNDIKSLLKKFVQ